jgi:hypothetical protein
VVWVQTKVGFVSVLVVLCKGVGVVVVVMARGDVVVGWCGAWF